MPRRPSTATGTVAWLLVYPDTYEIGLPNQGLQILYEILNERADAVAERAYAPWVDMEAAMRAAGVPLFSLENHLPAGDFDVLAFNLSAELVYTNVLNLIDLAGLPVRGVRAGSATHPLVVAGGHCAFNPEPLADFVDCFVLGDGEEAVGEITRGGGGLEGRRPAGRPPVACSGALARVEGVYVPACYEARYQPSAGPDAPALPRLIGTTPRFTEPPTRCRSGRSPTWPQWPYPRQQLVPLIEVVHDRLNVELFRGLHPGLPLLPGRDDHPPRARAAGRAGPDHGHGRAGPHRLRRGGADLPVQCRLLGHRGHRHLHHRRPLVLRPGVGQPPQPPGGRLHRGDRRPRSSGSAGPG